MRVLTYVGTDCYNKNRVRESHTKSSSFLLAFPFSNTRNKFFGIGCDTIAYIDGVDIRGQTYSTGCLSMCSDIGSVTNGSCNGIGCCQIPIPGNLLEYNVSVGSFGNHTDVDECKDSNLNKCLKNYCRNTNGNYTCACPKGYHGDGRKDGEGCSADQLLVVKILVGVGASVIVLVAVSGLLGGEKPSYAFSFRIERRSFISGSSEDCIAKEGNVEQVDKVARLVKTCLRVKGEERPTMKEVAMELERLRMVGKHPWTNVESNYEETEYLLGKKIDSSGHGKSGESSSGYQVIGSVLLPSGGR
ncbi:hypothetical protein OIU84_013375 [Salix udensis]|uniref:EGF-like calcium-binding domain-containing protein n=1 Tax=Salix udensis TaxID=889485 RepID=A0AAD6NUE9_9ROSI|nr:hypothetical protein OIU84_013375 [Salix udensis]